jgi:hypothetical protein
VDERYDEIVFTEPTRSFYKKLMKYVPSTDASTLPADGPSTATTIQLGYIPQVGDLLLLLQAVCIDAHKHKMRVLYHYAFDDRTSHAW